MHPLTESAVHAASRGPAFLVSLARFCLEASGAARTPGRFERYALLWITHGEGMLGIDYGSHRVGPGSIVFLTPFQAYRMMPHGRVEGIKIEFSAEFFSVERESHGVGCNGVLFNNVYAAPVLELGERDAPRLHELVDQMRSEFTRPTPAREEALFSLLKRFLIRASRLKLRHGTETAASGAVHDPRVRRFEQLVEGHFRQHHGAEEYARLLHLSASALNKLVRKSLRKAPRDLIRERLIVEAKRELSLVDDPVKEIGYRLGFEDPAYFSRFFKKETSLTPEEFRRRTRV